MTRDEQMWEAVAQEHGDLSMRDALVTLTAMEWADKTMIERSCKWLENRHNIEKCLNVLTSRTEDLSKAFRQAMEE